MFSILKGDVRAHFERTMAQPDQPGGPGGRSGRHYSIALGQVRQPHV